MALTRPRVFITSTIRPFPRSPATIASDVDGDVFRPLLVHHQVTKSLGRPRYFLFYPRYASPKDWSLNHARIATSRSSRSKLSDVAVLTVVPRSRIPFLSRDCDAEGDDRYRLFVIIRSIRALPFDYFHMKVSSPASATHISLCVSWAAIISFCTLNRSLGMLRTSYFTFVRSALPSRAMHEATHFRFDMASLQCGIFQP